MTKKRLDVGAVGGGERYPAWAPAPTRVGIDRPERGKSMAPMGPMEPCLVTDVWITRKELAQIAGGVVSEHMRTYFQEWLDALAETPEQRAARVKQDRELAGAI